MKKILLIAAAIMHAGLFTAPASAQEGYTETPAEKLKRMHPGARPKGPITSFHRRAVDSNEAPWKAVGRVNVGGYAHCSGSLIAERIVLTAAHCLYLKHTGHMAPAPIVHFLAGYSKGEYQAHSKVKQYTIGRGFDAKKGPTGSNIQHDWALLLLEEPIGAQQGFLELHENLKRSGDPKDKRTKVALPTNQIVTAGYPGDRSHVLSLEEDCSVMSVRARGRLLVTDCTAIPGDSGGPILQQHEGAWNLIGLNVASVSNDEIQGSIVLSGLAFRDTFSAIQRQLARQSEAKQDQSDTPAGD